MNHPAASAPAGNPSCPPTSPTTPEATSPAARGPADLHLHSIFSDGTHTPEDLAMLGRQHGMSALSLTDHDTVEGCARMAAACQRLGLEFLPGVELTAQSEGSELHFIGYGLEVHHPLFTAEIAKYQKARQERIREMVSLLNKINIPLQADAVFALANCQSPGRPHVGRALVQAGLCASMDEAFDRFLKKNRPAWVPKFKISSRDAIHLIHQAGGLAILAHPGLNRTDDVIPELVAAGLDGLECFHSKHSNATTGHYLQIADQHRLLVTGGSDCHGHSKGRPTFGGVRIPYDCVRRLKLRLAARAAVAPAQATLPAHPGPALAPIPC